jgi:hypothetical protein
MSTIEASIDLEVPIQFASEEWNRDQTLSEGVASFEALDAYSTRLVAHLSFEPPDNLGEIGDAIVMIEARVRADLERFKERVEAGARISVVPDEVVLDRSA